MQKNISKAALLHDINKVAEIFRRIKPNKEFLEDNYIYCCLIEETLAHLQREISRCHKPIT